MIAASAGWFLENAWLIPIIPGIGFVLIILFGKQMPRGGSEIGLLSMGGSVVLAAGTVVQWIQRVDDAGAHEGGGHALASFGRSLVAQAEGGHGKPFVEPVTRSWVWWESGGIEIGFGQHIDGLAVMALILVAFISLLVQIFSLEYVRGDSRYTHFFAAMTLFSAGMLVMVLAENMVQIILGWEIMGLCSFMLIGHWWEEEANARAALKAFFTVRVGDVGLLVGTAILFFGANQWAADNMGSNGFNIEAISAWALSGDGSSTVLLMTAVALFIACIGKSGQFPLHTWLPDAMAGPTPVSSLLHSSTMVVAGVFLVARLYPVFWEGFSIGEGAVNLIVIIAAITIVISALLAFVQVDIKKVLAYSTVSQLGYMMLGLGTGAWLPAVFHIFTHAFFKCCLFLCAGSVSHSGSHHSFDMKKDMGGLAKKMPITAATWIISSLALAGVFPLSGFFSKDEIIDNVGNNGYDLFMWIGLAGAFLTAGYMARATYLTFFGEARGAAAGEHHAEHGHDDIHAIEPELVGAGATVGALHADDAARLAGSHGDDPEGDDVAHSLDDIHAHDTPDEHDHGHGPRESPKLILVPICILAFLAIVAGYTNAPPFGESFEKFSEYVEPSGEAVAVAELDEGAGAAGEGGEAGAEGAEAGGEGEVAAGGVEEVHFFPEVSHAEFKWSKAALSLAIVAAGIVSCWLVSWQLYGRRNPRLLGLTQRLAPARLAYAFLWNKYYLDHLYEKVIVRGVAHPIAKAAYWTNQNLLDGIVNGVGLGGKRAGGWVYRNIDQRVVDGAVNGSGTATSESGHALQPMQSGKVNQYGALLFGAAAVFAIVLVIVNVN